MTNLTRWLFPIDKSVPTGSKLEQMVDRVAQENKSVRKILRKDDSLRKELMYSIQDSYYENKNLIIIDRGRNRAERSVVQIENGKYIGFGYLNIEESYVHLDSFLDCIKIFEDNRDIHQIIETYLNNNNVEKIIRY